MTLQQLSAIKRWHITHHRSASVEFLVWDAVLTLWMTGCLGLVPSAVLAPRLGLLLCAMLYYTPAGYVRLRGRLHRRGVLRCDWLPIARAAA